MREIVLDTETTGLDPQTGDRVVEIGAVELLNHLPTGNNFHAYINPRRSMPQGAFEVHGLSDEFLRNKPPFEAVAPEFASFVGAEAKLVIHNASFDMKFLAWEFRAAGLEPLPMSRAIDTLEIARARFPGAPASLDALCRRFGVDNSGREKHGALLDAELLAEVYLELIGGRQPDLVLAAPPTKDARRTPEPGTVSEGWSPHPRPHPLPSRLTDEEAQLHAQALELLGEGALWRR